MNVKSLVFLTVLLTTATACSTDEPAGGDAAALEQQVVALTAELNQATTELETAAAERDALAAQIAAAEVRYEKTDAAEQLIIEIIDDPDVYGTQEEVLDAVAALAVPGAVMDDTAFGAVPIRSAWRNTLYGGLDAEIKTWKRWLSDDGSQGASLWTWIGTARNGEPFELIGINLTDYDEEGTVTNILVDWPYEGTFVREAIAKGNALASEGG